VSINRGVLPPMRRRSVRAVPALLAGVGLVLTALAAPTAAATATEESAVAAAAVEHERLPDPKVKGRACRTDRGITVVVDFRDLRTEAGRRMNLVRIGCARRAGDGLAALTRAGFDLEHRAGFVCRIDERPLPDDTRCGVEGYWSYWHGERGGEWEYSGVGAGSWNPPPGSLEGWAWNWYDESEADPRVEPDELFPPLG
jgi:hypothetical protein